MAKFTATRLDEAPVATGYAAPRHATGVEWSKRVSPDDYPLWMVVSRLADGGTITWSGEHGDDGLYVIDGALDFEGRVAPRDGAAVVESNVACTARAVGTTKVLHCGTASAAPPADGDYGPPSPDGHGVHIVGEQGWYESGNRENVVARWFADSTCPTCRISMFHVWRKDGGVKDLPHTHTQDELIYLLGGGIKMGALSFGPDTCLAIPANLRYSLVSGDDGFAFVNYRRDVSTQHYGKVKPPELEGAIARGGRYVGDLR